MPPGKCDYCDIWTNVVHHHRFPRNEERARQWAISMNWVAQFEELAHYKNVDSIFICSEHFDATSYKENDRRNNLKWGAKPREISLSKPSEDHDYARKKLNGIPPITMQREAMPDGNGLVHENDRLSIESGRPVGGDEEEPVRKKAAPSYSQTTDNTWPTSTGLSQDISEPSYEKETEQEKSIRKLLENESLAKTGASYSLLAHSSLIELLDMMPGCMRCRDKHARRKFSMVGAVLQMETDCSQCKKWNWFSTPKVHNDKMGSLLEGNVGLSASMFLAGISYERMSDACATMGLGITRRNTHYDLIKKHIRPVIDCAFEKDVADVIERLEKTFPKNQNMKTPLSLIGDAQYDSRGFSAGVVGILCMMEYESRFIVGTEVMMKRDNQGNSPIMESRSCCNIMTRLKNDSRLEVKQLTTDKNTAVISMLRKQFPETAHKLDKWHVIKNFKKTNNHEIQLVRNANLRAYWEHILVHAWTSIETANGDKELASELIRSTEFHLQGVHSLPKDEFSRIDRCPHSPNMDFSQKAVLDPIIHKKQIQVLHGMLNDPTFLANIGNCAAKETTSPLEAFHSMIAQIYFLKNNYFDEETTKTLMKLATIHHNNHRREILDALDAGYVFATRMKYSKAQSRLREVIVHPKPNLSWKQAMLQDIKEHYKMKKDETITNRILGRPRNEIPLGGEGGEEGGEESDGEEDVELAPASETSEDENEDTVDEQTTHDDDSTDVVGVAADEGTPMTSDVPLPALIIKQRINTTPLQFPKVYRAMGIDADKYEYYNKFNGLMFLPL